MKKLTIIHPTGIVKEIRVSFIEIDDQREIYIAYSDEGEITPCAFIPKDCTIIESIITVKDETND